MKIPASYRVLKRFDATYRRIRQSRAARYVVRSNTIFLLIIPLLYATIFLFHRTHTVYHLYTGPKGGTYEILGPALADALNKPDQFEQFLHLNIVPDFVVRPSCGAVDNLYLTNHGLAQVAFSEDGLPVSFETMAHCPLPTSQQNDAKVPKPADIRFRALMPLYLSPLHIVARKNLHIADIRALPSHTKVYLGPDGSGTAALAQLILHHYGIVVQRYGAHLDFEQGKQALLRGDVDVGFFLHQLNSDVVHTLLEADQFTLMAIDHAASLKLLYPYLEVITVPGTTYKSPATDVTTIGTKTILITTTDLTELEVYEIAKKLSYRINEIIKGIPFNVTKVTDSDPQKDLYYPLHDGSIRFYTHDPPFFLDIRTVAEIGTYFTVLFALFEITTRLLRRYRIHRLMHVVDHAAQAFIRTRQNATRYHWHARKVKVLALVLVRHNKINHEDFQHVDEYIKGHA
jgi:TRAP transporter TAXI family solute receptor